MIILGRTEILVQMDPTDLILKIAGFDDIECRVFPKMPLYSLELDEVLLFTTRAEPRDAGDNSYLTHSLSDTEDRFWYCPELIDVFWA